MSLLWRNHLRISLCADRLVLGTYSSGLRPAKPRKELVSVQPLANAPEWQAALDALPGVLARAKDHDVSIVLADQFVRYTVLPWTKALRTDEQWTSLARHRLAAVHGPAAADWHIKVTETAPEGPRLACAVDRELLEQLAAKFAAAGVRLVSAQPFLVAAFNKVRSAILGMVGRGSCWLVVEEPGRLTLAFIQRGVWVALRSRRIDKGWRARLPEMIDRESAFLALSEPCTSVLVCAEGPFDTGQYGAWHTKTFDYRDLALAWE